MASVFETLKSVNVNGHTEKKNGLTYLSWAWAWAEVKKAFPDAQYTIYERDTEFGAVPYYTDGKTCWVKTGVTIEGLEHVEMLPIMDFKNRSIPLDAVTSMDMNKAIQRSLTKACARHGLGLYIYAGEDLPEGEAEQTQPEEKAQQMWCARCQKPITEAKGKSGETMTAEQVLVIGRKFFGGDFCASCQKVLEAKRKEQRAKDDAKAS